VLQRSRSASALVKGASQVRPAQGVRKCRKMQRWASRPPASPAAAASGQAATPPKALMKSRRLR